ncbi:MAG: YihY/virulence factor BrkB family protein [Casimicrobiaceae bacterium]
MNQKATASSKDDAATMRKVAFNPKAIWALARDSVSAWIDDFAPSMGAAISYYTVFSIAPLLLIVIAIAGFVLGRDAASGKIFAELQGMLGTEGAAAIQGMVKSASDPAKSTLGTIIGVVTLLIGATTVFAELQSALDRIWRAPAATKSEGIWTLLRTRFLSFGMILAIGFLLLISLVVSAGLSTLGNWWAPFFGGWSILLQTLNLVVSVAIVTVMFGVIYKYLPRAHIGWHDVWIGAVVTGLLFTIGKFLIGLYIGKTGVASGFGAAGSIVVVLVWVYYSAQIFLLGAEFTWHYAYQFGSRRGQQPSAAAVTKSAANQTSAGSGAAKGKVAAAPTTAPHLTRASGSSIGASVGPKQALARLVKPAQIVAVATAAGALLGLITRHREAIRAMPRKYRAGRYRLRKWWHRMSV